MNRDYEPGDMLFLNLKYDKYYIKVLLPAGAEANVVYGQVIRIHKVRSKAIKVGYTAYFTTDGCTTIKKPVDPLDKLLTALDKYEDGYTNNKC